MIRMKRWNGEHKSRYALNTLSFRCKFKPRTEYDRLHIPRVLSIASSKLADPNARKGGSLCASSRPTSCNEMNGYGEKMMRNKSICFSVTAHGSHPLIPPSLSPSF
jgi:hypothetical protein